MQTSDGGRPGEGEFYRPEALQATGSVVLRQYDQARDPAEWEQLTYVDWKSSGDTRFSPLASAYGQMECDGFWNHTPPKTDRDGMWVAENVAVAPRLVARAKEPGANIGRCRVIELQPNSYADTIYNLHRDSNNRLNEPGNGWIVRGFFNLTDDPDSMMVLREDRDDPSTETRIAPPAGAQVVIDTERLWHAVWHPNPARPRYCLITSWTSGPELDAYLAANDARSDLENAHVDADLIHSANEQARARLAQRQAAKAKEVRSEA